MGIWYPIVDEMVFRFDFSVKGKARPKAGQGRIYMPSSYTSNKATISWLLKTACMHRLDFFSATALFATEALQFRTRPKPKSKKDAIAQLTDKPIGGFCRGSRQVADTDNFVGTLMDAAPGIIYADDDQVVSSVEERVWCPNGQTGAIWKVLKLGDPCTTKLACFSDKMITPISFT